MELRPARAADLPGIFAIYDHYVRHSVATFDIAVKSEAERLQWLLDHTQAPYTALVVEDGGRIAGWATLGAWSPKCAYARAAEVSIYVADDARRRGIGRLLMQGLIDHARAGGLAVLLSRIADRGAESVAFHRRCGFSTIGVMRRVGEKFSRVLDVELMDLHLDGAAEPQ